MSAERALDTCTLVLTLVLARILAYVHRRWGPIIAPEATVATCSLHANDTLLKNVGGSVERRGGSKRTALLKGIDKLLIICVFL